MWQHTILLIDDDLNILRSLQRILRKEGYDVLTARDSQEGFSLLERHQVDLIISDQNMPGMNGLDFFKASITRFPETINILLTGNADLDLAIEAINNCNIYKFLIKPCNSDELKITIKRALEHFDLVREKKDLSNQLREQDAVLQNLEKTYPGITKKPGDGIYKIE